MGSTQPDPPGRRAFVFTECSKGGYFEAYSCGDGHFYKGTPSEDLDICFTLYKTQSFLDIEIHEDSLLQWLRSIPSLCDDLADDLFDGTISMGLLLPRYPDLSARFDQDQREGHSFDALELFVCHFLREGSVFATFGFERLHEEHILTDVHFNDIQSQSRSMSEDLDLLDEAIDETDNEDIKRSSHPSGSRLEDFHLSDGADHKEVRQARQRSIHASLVIYAYGPEQFCLLDEATDGIDGGDRNNPRHSFRSISQPFRHQLQAAIARRDPSAAEAVLAQDPGFVDAYTLCLAIRYYERTVFHLLLKHGAEVEGVNSISETLYRAAKAGHMDVVQLLLEYDVDTEGGDLGVSATPLTGAASGGHLEIVQYLLEEKGANINGNSYKSPLSRAIKHCHTHIIDYLLRAGADVLGEDCFALLPQLAESQQAEVGDTLERFMAGIDNDARDLWLSTAVSKGQFEIVRCLVAAGAHINPGTRHCNASETSLRCTPEHSAPLAVAASRGDLEIVRYLVAAGANVNPDMRHCHAAETFLTRTGEQSLPLAVAALEGHFEIVRYLEEAGAQVNPDPWYRAARNEKNTSCHRSSGYSFLSAAAESGTKLKQVAQYLASARAHFIEVVSTNDCPAIATIQAQERRTMARRLLVGISNSCRKLLDASNRKNASAELIAFVGQIGTSSSVWNSGTRAIRDLCEGYMPRSLSEIVSVLQVANAMRSVVPPSSLVYSKKEFVNDIPRWAALLRLDDQRLFFEIASNLWGTPAYTITYERPDSSADLLMALQDLVSRLVRTYGLFDQELGNSGGAYRLQTLRQQHLFAACSTQNERRRLTLAKWHLLRAQADQESLHGDAPKPPDPEEERFSILARITVLMAGAIFGAILLYLCLSRYGFPTLRLPILTSDAAQGCASDQITTRNYIIIAMYVGFTSTIDMKSTKDTDHLPPEPWPLPVAPTGNHPTAKVQEYMAAVQSCNEGGNPTFSPLSAITSNMETSSEDYSPSVSSRLTTSSATSTSPPSMKTATHGLAPIDNSIGETICCERCDSKFKLGKNGRRGQASNLRKHIKIHHPETIPDYHRVIYECRHGCGARDPNKSNIKAHESKHCANRKGKQPRRHGKWRRTITGTC